MFDDAEEDEPADRGGAGGEVHRGEPVHAAREHGEGQPAELYRGGTARQAEPLYEKFVACLREMGFTVETGV